MIGCGRHTWRSETSGRLPVAYAWLVQAATSLGSSLHAREISYHEIFVPLPAGAVVESKFNRERSSLELLFKNVPYAALQILEQTKIPGVPRVIFRETPGFGTRVRLDLGDPELEPSVDVFEQPLRMRLAVYHREFETSRHPLTGLPQLALASGERVSRPVTAPAGGAAPSAPPAEESSGGVPPGELRLLRPSDSESAEDFQAIYHDLDAVVAGPGQHWPYFPIYVYPLDVMGFFDAVPQTPRPGKDRYLGLGYEALKAFAAGHELKARYLLDRVLSAEPHLLTRVPAFAWALAECHLGTGNLALARGFYRDVAERFPDSVLAGLSNLRLLDLRAAENHPGDELRLDSPEVSARLDSYAAGSFPELAALAQLRRIYWSRPEGVQSRQVLASSDPDRAAALRQAAGHVATPQTAELARLSGLVSTCADTGVSARVIGEEVTRVAALHDTSPRWQEVADGCRDALQNALDRERGSADLEAYSAGWEAIPTLFESPLRTPDRHWDYAEALRQRNLWSQAVDQYRKLSESGVLTDPQRQFLASYHLVVDAYLRRSDVPEDEARQRGVAMTRGWEQLPHNLKKTLIETLRFELLSFLQLEAPVPSVAHLLLDAWAANYRSRSDAAADPGATSYGLVLDASAIEPLVQLAAWFRRLGEENFRIQALELLRWIVPEANTVWKSHHRKWSDGVLALADAYRSQNDYLRAGETFVHVGDAGVDLERRAESFYKGGLLLYRAGKRDDAVRALTAASQDGNNLHFAHLAKQRLEKIQ